MIRKISATLSFLLFVCVVTPMDNHFFGGILQPDSAFAQSDFMLDDFALYSQKEIRLDKIADSRGNVGSNGSIDIKKGVTGSVIGFFQALDRIKNEAEIGIYGDVTAQVIEDRGSLSVSGQKIESADLVPITLPTFLFYSSGPDLEVPENTSMNIFPGSYGHLKIKKGAVLNLSSGEYYFVKFETYEFASVTLDVSAGAIHINIVEKMKIKDDVDMQIVGGGPEDVLFNFRGTDKVEVEDRSVLRGILTAPSAKVNFDKGSRLEGAVYADSIHLEKGASFRHYAASMDGRPPTADAGGYQTALAGGQVVLDGSGSSDPDGDAITYNWSFVSFPDGSSPILSDPTDAMPTFTADLAGVYAIELAVDDGTYASLKDTATITAVSELLGVTDFVLYADDKIKMDEISGGVGHVGANRKVHIEKGLSGTITGDLRVLDKIKNDGQIIIDGDVVTNSQIDDHGDFTVTGLKIENASLTPRMRPPLLFSVEGPDLEVPASTVQTLAPGSYGRVKVKKGATLQFTAGTYFLRELKTDDFAILIFDASEGGIELNVVKKLEFGKDAKVQITGGSTRDILINYAGKKEVEIEDRGILRGTLVAPKAKVEFEKDSRLEGAVYAKKIYLDKGVSFQFHEPDAANNPPVADIQTITTVEDTPASITLSGSDPDGDSLTFNVNSQPLHGTLAGTAPDLTYTPYENFNGADEFSFTVNDGTVDADPATVNITVAAVNDAPVANVQTISLNEDESKPVLLSGFDVEGDTFAYEIVEDPSQGTLSGTAPDLIYTPDVNYYGNDSFSFRVNDGNLTGNTAIVSLTINPVNDAPVADAGSDQSVFRLETVTLDGSGSGDVDNKTLSYHWSFFSMPPGSKAAFNDPSLSGQSFVADLAGIFEIVLVVNDGTIYSAPHKVTITAFPRMVTVPDVTNLSQTEAGAAIIEADLVVGTITPEPSNTMPADHVISQNPSAGSSIEEGSAIDMVVSLGPEIQPPTVSFSASSSEINQGQHCILTWSATNANSAHIDNGIGSVAVADWLNVSPEHTTTYTITAIGPYGNASAQVVVKVISHPQPPPEGSYGEQYEDLIPDDATVEEYDPVRFSLITGLVKNSQGLPLSDVAITIHGHAQYGTVNTDGQGVFSIPVEGGGTLNVIYQKQGFISSQRKVYVPWNDNAVVEAVVMIPEDPLSTTLTFDDNPETVVTHKSSDVTDPSGLRACTMVFTGDNQAYLVDEKGNDVRPLDTITVRATEYSSPESMPAKLPPNSAFTYCVELSVDGAERVRFKDPVLIWVNNFLGFPVGSIVPVGFYDRDKGVWVPSQNGKVVELRDTDGDGVVDAFYDGSDLNDVKGLEDSASYPPGATFWRVALDHFTPCDLNWPFGAPPGAIDPNPNGPSHSDGQKDDGTDPQRHICSFVEEKSRIFHEDIPIPGTDMTLHYASSRTAGYLPGVLTVPASGDTVPDDLVRIVVKVKVAGKEYQVDLPAEPNRTAEIQWDGLDHLGRPVTGPVGAQVEIGFVYYGVYFRPGSDGQAFGRAGLSSLRIPTRQEVILWQKVQVPIIRGMGTLAEGWSISSHHQVSPLDPSLIFKGDGTISRNNVMVINTYAGNGSGGYGGDGGPATEAALGYRFHGIDTDAAGNLYIVYGELIGWQNFSSGVRKVDANGIITRDVSFLTHPHGVAVDDQGNIYLAEHSLSVVYKFDTNGVKTTYAGIYNRPGYNGDGIPAIQAKLNYTWGLDVDAEGNLYIADKYNHRIRKVDSSGIITTVVGNGLGGNSGDGGPATQATLTYPSEIAVDKAGNLYITAGRTVRMVDVSGIITTVAGNGDWLVYGDGGPATEAGLGSTDGLDVDALGNLYIVSSETHRVRKVDTNGIITTIAGSGPVGWEKGDFSGDGGAATRARMNNPDDVAVDAAGNIFVADDGNRRIRIVSPPAARLQGVMGASDMAFTEDTGVGYIMSPAGRHLKTVDLDTGVSLYEFGYDGDNNLISITDQFDNPITIEWENGVPTAIISADGITTGLTVDPVTRHLTDITYPDGSVYTFDYTPDGLELTKTQPELNQFGHIFDQTGRITNFTDDEGGHWQFSRTVLDDGDVWHETLTGEGDRTTYLERQLPTGAYSSTITSPAGAETQYERSADGLLETLSLPCGMEQEYTYDVDAEYKYKYVKKMIERTPLGLQRVTQKTKTYSDANADGVPDLITEQIAVNGKTASIVHDTPGSRRSLTSPEGRSMTALYDPATLLPIRMQIPELHDTVFEFDTRGRIKTITTDIRQTVFDYVDDQNGHQITVTDPEKSQTIYEFDALDRPRLIQRPDGSSVDFDYDDNGNMELLINPAGIKHGFDYTQVNLKEFYHPPLSGSYRYVYDKDRRLKETYFPSGRRITNVYEDGRLELIDLPLPEADIDLGYRACGPNLESLVKGGEGISFGYDGSLLTSENASGTLEQSLVYTYDNDFRIETFQYAGQTEGYEYDNDNLLTAAGRFSITRNINNGLPEAVTADDLNLTPGFNSYGELDAEAYTVNGINVASWSVTRRDGAGRILEKTETVDGATSIYEYMYDPAGRLRTVTKNGGLVEEYQYDPNGTGTRVYEMNALRGMADRVYDYSDEDHLLIAGETSYQNDVDGFLTTKTDGSDVTNYTYSSRGELLSVNLPDGRTIEYIHDPLGRRIAKKVDGVFIEKYLWQSLTRLLAVYDGSDNLLLRFEYASSRVPMAVNAEGVTYYLTYDQVGSLRVVADAAGNVIKKIEYDAFGNVIEDTNASFDILFGFAGGLHDQDIGLVRFGYRDYDPDIGRWTAKDPIGFAGGDTDLFGYVLNDPVNLIDPLGLEFSDILPGIKKAIVEGTKGGAYAVGEATKATAEIAMHGHPLAQTALGLAAVSVTAPLAGAAAISATPSAVSAAFIAAPYSGAIVDFIYGAIPETGPPKGIGGYVGSFSRFIAEQAKNAIEQTGLEQENKLCE